MAGLVAIAAESPDACVSLRELDQLAACYRTLRHESERARVQAGDLGAAVAFGDPDDTSLQIERSNGSWAVAVGSLHPDGSSTVDADPRSLDGQFGLIRYTGEPARLEIVTDRFALQALYVAHQAGLIFCSTSALALAKHLRARPDLEGIEVFLRTGPHFGAITNWEGIERLSPAAVHSCGATGDQPAVYWRPEVDRSVWSLGLQAAARRCVEVSVASFRQRYDSLIGERSWCDLSGGYDTRLAALLLDRAGVRFATNTNGSPAAIDARIAKRVAALAGWRWELGRLQPDWAAVCEQAYAGALAWGDGMLEASQLAEVLALQRQHAGAGSVLFNGGGGEHWRDYAWKQELPFGGRRKRVNFERWVDVRFMHPVDVTVFKSDPTARARDNLVSRCRAYAAPYADELNAVSLDVLYAYKAMAHFGAYQSAARGTVRVELPFYAREVFEAAFSVAPRHRNSHRLARVAMEALNRKIAALPTTHGDPAVPMRVRNAHRFAPFFTTRARGVARKVSQQFPGPTLAPVKEVTPSVVHSGRRRVLDDFAAYTNLDPARMRSGSLYDAGALRRLASSETATTSGWRTLGRIITVERALEVVDAEL